MDTLSVTSSTDTMSAILKLEAEVRKLPQDDFQKSIRTDHYFADGMYARVLFRPKGALIIGKVHKKEHFYIVAMGCVQIEKNVYPAGTVIVSKPGTKRAVLALEDSICLTVHRTKKRNLANIEKQLIEPDAKALFDSSNKLKELT
jgi:hypothetical protein